MNILKILSIVSVIVWLFPPIKQYKTQYFYFFLIPAVFQLSQLFLYLLFNLSTNHFYPTYFFLLISALLQKKERIIFIVVALACAIIFPAVHFSREVLYSISAILSIIVFLMVLYSAVSLIVKTQSINLFLILLIAYLSIDLPKLVDLALNIKSGLIYYYVGTVAQCLFAVAFCFINIDTKNFRLPLKSSGIE